MAKKKSTLPIFAPYYIDCPRCDGKKTVMRYPHYSTVMPPMVEMPCEECGGTGRILVVPDNTRIARESDIIKFQ